VAKFRSYGQLDDPFVEDGDPAFRGLDQQTEPTMLQAGFVQEAENVRFDQGVISSRKGLEKFADISGGKALVKFLNPVDNREDLIVVTNDKLLGVGENAIRIGRYEQNADKWDEIDYRWETQSQINEQFSDPYGDDDEVFGLQVFDQIILFCKDNRPRTFDGNVSGQGVIDLPPTSSDTSVDFVCPNAPFGYYFSNRLVVPYYEDSPTTVAFSDVFELNEFINLNTYFCNKGTADVIMGFSSFVENQILVLCKNSIHLINNTHALGTSSTNYEITRQYGVAGHRAFTQNGSYTYFVSSEGNIQVLVPSSDPAKGLGIAISKVTLDQEPLSKPITPFMERVNLEYIRKSIVYYHKNKVYFCLPIDGSSELNAIAIYDSLNSTWVSIDTFEDEFFAIRDINSIDNQLYLLSDKKVYKYETGATDDGNSILAKVRTRDYMMSTRDVKKFVRGTISYSAEEGSALTIRTFTKSPDSTTLCKESYAEEDSLNNLSRFSTRQRGYSASVEVNNTGGHLKVKSVSMEAFVHAGKALANFRNG